RVWVRCHIRPKSLPYNTKKSLEYDILINALI
ncbi:unnamed protein product, partial [Callosobruchus maculatus]